MSKAGSAAKVKLSSYDDLFGNAEEKTGSEEQIIRAKLTVNDRIPAGAKLY